MEQNNPSSKERLNGKDSVDVHEITCSIAVYQTEKKYRFQVKKYQQRPGQRSNIVSATGVVGWNHTSQIQAQLHLFFPSPESHNDVEETAQIFKNRRKNNALQHIDNRTKTGSHQQKDYCPKTELNRRPRHY
jgi:hypothetical protein